MKHTATHAASYQWCTYGTRWNTLQHTLQHTATHCNTHCNTHYNTPVIHICKTFRHTLQPTAKKTATRYSKSYICICIHNHVIVNTYTYIYIYVYTYIYICTHIYTNINICIHIYLFTQPSRVAVCIYGVLTSLVFFPPIAQLGQLPLHCAAGNQAGPEVVAALLHAYPAAASMADKVCCRADYTYVHTYVLIHMYTNMYLHIHL